MQSSTRDYSTVTTDKLKNALTEVLQPRMTAFRASIVTGYELDDRVLEADIQRFRPDGLLVMRPKDALLSPAGALWVVYDATLLEPKEDRVIWKARLRGEGYVSRRVRMMAHDLGRRWTRSGLLKRLENDELLEEQDF
jgi:hypothetical protein